jgi:hypothetical protein
MEGYFCTRYLKKRSPKINQVRSEIWEAVTEKFWQHFCCRVYSMRCAVTSGTTSLVPQLVEEKLIVRSLLLVTFGICSFRCSSGGIVSDHGLDDWKIEVRSPTGAEDFSSSPCVQTGSGAHPASYPVGTGSPFPGGKARPGRDANHSPPSSAEVKYE